MFKQFEKKINDIESSIVDLKDKVSLVDGRVCTITNFQNNTWDGHKRFHDEMRTASTTFGWVSFFLFFITIVNLVLGIVNTRILIKAESLITEVQPLMPSSRK